MLPCDQRSEADQVDDLNAALDDAEDGMGLVIGLLWVMAFWAALALVALG